MSTATIIDGRKFSATLRGRIAEEVTRLKNDHDLTPGLAVVLVGEDPASQVYVRSKGKQTLEAGMNSYEHKMPAETTQEELLAKVEELNNDPAVHGILVQLPVPDHIDDHAIINAIDPNKDVDGFHVINSGRLATGARGASAPMIPCTPLGSIMLLKDHLGDLSSKTAVVVGRSNIVGKPMAQLLLQESCTVTIAHSRTKDLPDVVRQADIVVAAVGRPEMVKGDWVKPGATVIDVGINRIEVDGKNKLVGDVATAEAMEHAGAITPVPGGVGPMTIACLLANTLTAASRQNGLEEPNLL
ncbi:bifunctional methylenetetrahydrofolate dehydrogenase/methenyltetrahydrofolate cyclohydrolase FolD [Kiloniella sp. EL199]|uniref:bifunctional methylenetetrahydrofolate dehydrogenase/methenyltetrahydrofolate cyclohydrolase FolD n=1 Tax=Kiloniella sp. EL199 TaxID=2107581 RepID=UPI000EA35EF6|nr:bifunctional methylenetetrahydrofolate dehydrogenase/methenyltetrahydrofolate cyclohydrolase FolD [Kiloniella sp. EL199]